MVTSVWLFKPRSHGRKKEGVTIALVIGDGIVSSETGSKLVPGTWRLLRSSGETEVMCCSARARVPSEPRATKLIGTRPRLPASVRTAAGDRTR